MEPFTNNPPATFESVWAALQETDRLQKKNAMQLERSSAEFAIRIKKLEELTGSWANSHGSFAENYFYNSFEKGKVNFFGKKFDDIGLNVTNHWKGLKDEYDIVLYNQTSVALIEVKYKANENDIPKVVKKADTFRILFPHYNDCKVYLGLASLSFLPSVEKACIDQGIAIIKQAGDSVIIKDSHLKAY